eukprot:2255520-Prymnesium_polylepis.1
MGWCLWWRVRRRPCHPDRVNLFPPIKHSVDPHLRHLDCARQADHQRRATQRRVGTREYRRALPLGIDHLDARHESASLGLEDLDGCGEKGGGEANEKPILPCATHQRRPCSCIAAARGGHVRRACGLGGRKIRIVILARGGRSAGPLRLRRSRGLATPPAVAAVCAQRAGIVLKPGAAVIANAICRVVALVGAQAAGTLRPTPLGEGEPEQKTTGAHQLG